MSRAVMGVGATALLPNCATTEGGGGGSLSQATKDRPFVNSLGMKFVPVPGTKVLFCTTETTVEHYQAAGRGYQAPGFAQEANHPAVNVSWHEAKDWCAWLSRKEKRRYRLPTDAEWSAAAGGDTYAWGSAWPPPNHAGNYAGQEMRGTTEAERALLFKGFSIIGGFSDRHKFTAPAGSYPANRLGIHDLGGNVWEWCEDGHPQDRTQRVLRGGSWGSDYRRYLALSYRLSGAPGGRDHGYGFRCVVA